MQNLTLAVAQQAHRLTRKLEDSIRRSTRERLQDYLSAQYHKAGSRTFVIPLNRQDLADFLFVDRSAMSNELCKMRDEGSFSSTRAGLSCSWKCRSRRMNRTPT